MMIDLCHCIDSTPCKANINQSIFIHKFEEFFFSQLYEYECGCVKIIKEILPISNAGVTCNDLCNQYNKRKQNHIQCPGLNRF